MITLAIVIFAVLALLSMPLAFALGGASIVGIVLSGFPITTLVERMQHSVNSFPLMAIPLFILAGELMVRAGMIKQLINFSNSLVGRAPGGLATVTIFAGAFLAAVSGAAVASASALGSALVPELRKYYPDEFSSAVIASSSNLGPIIPPSNAMIVYALMAGSSVSVGGMFAAGIIPGIILMSAFITLAMFLAWRRGYPATGEKFKFSTFFRALRQAWMILLMPVIVLGGIMFGYFTATEGAAIAVAYALISGFGFRRLNIKDLIDSIYRCLIVSAMIAALIAFASAITFLFSVEQVPASIAAWIQGFTTSPYLFVLLTVCILVVVGMFLESNAAYIMLVPLFAPIALLYGLDPLWFGFIFVLDLVVGMMTPPIGVLYFVVCGITGLPMGKVVKESIPFVIIQFLVLGLCIAVPPIVTWLPHALGF